MTEFLIDRIQKLVGPRAVLIPIALGTKFPVQTGWQNITYADTQTAAYQTRLEDAIRRGGNICVRLGPLSNGLCTIDIDRADLLETLTAANTFLKATTTTQGRPGRAQFWLKMKSGSVYPNSQAYYNLKLDGQKVGKWRCGGGIKAPTT
jgi:Bifunctional DNA primase/polymerase, N-terminal